MEDTLSVEGKIETNMRVAGDYWGLPIQSRGMGANLLVYVFLGQNSPPSLSWFAFCYCNKHHYWNQLAGQRVFQLIAYKSLMKWSQKRNSRQDLRQRPWRNTVHWFVSHGSFRELLIQPRTTCPGMVPLTVTWTLTHQSFIKKIPTIDVPIG